jgi:translation initiation factor IF-3
VQNQQKEVYAINNKPRQGGRVPQKKANLINEEITARELRVLDENGEQAGIMLLETAQQLADNRRLDLVLISPNADPPVARIMDYGKYRYEQQKREKEAKKKQKVIEIKEIRLSTFIEKHDLEVKTKNAMKFLKEGDKVKVSLRFKGRERGRTEKGFEVMNRFALLTEDYGKPEKQPAFEGRSLMMILSPLQEKERKAKLLAKEQAAEAEKALAEDENTEVNEAEINAANVETTELESL